MRRGQRLDAKYRRVLWIGLTVSIAVHGLLLAFARFSAEVPGPQQRDLALLDIELLQDPPMQLIEFAEAAGNDAALEISEIAGDPAATAFDLPFSDANTLNESSYILARASSAHLEFAVVPRPALLPVNIETGFSPMYVIDDGTHLAAVEVVDHGEGSSRRGGGIRISIGMGGHGDCPAPTAGVFINRQNPIAPVFGRTSAVGGGFQIRPGRIGLSGRGIRIGGR